MNGKEPYAFYRYAMALIKGELRDKGINRQDIETGHKLLTQAANADNPVILYLFRVLKLLLNWVNFMRKEVSNQIHKICIKCQLI